MIVMETIKQLIRVISIMENKTIIIYSGNK